MSLYPIASLGLFFRQRWAGFLYVSLVILGYVFMGFLGPTVEHAIADAVDEVAVLISGMIISLIAFTDVLSPTPSEATKPVEPTGTSSTPPDLPPSGALG